MTTKNSSINGNKQMISHTKGWATCLAVLAMTISVHAGIPQPDYVLHGTVSYNNQPLIAQDDATIIARLAGSNAHVGQYRMGQSTAAGDNYVLRVHLESNVDNSSPSTNAARIGDQVNIYVRLGNICDGGTNDGGPCASLNDCPDGDTCGREELLTPDAPISLTSVGHIQNLNLPPSACDSIRPRLMHDSESMTPCSGYIDPRRESNNGTDTNLGITSVTMVFDEEIRSIGGAALTPASFVVTETGGGSPPSIDLITLNIVDGLHVVTISLDRPITPREWTTIQAVVEDTCGNRIEDLGNMGSQTNEPDRIDIGFLPGDIDQSGATQPVDLFFLRGAINNGTLPSNACDATNLVDLADMDRNGLVTPIDVFIYRQLINGVGASTRSWSGVSMVNSRP